MLSCLVRMRYQLALAAGLIVLGVSLIPVQTRGDETPLLVVASVPDLGSLAREVGGDHVDVTVLAKGTEDPHFVEAKPSFIKILSQADVCILMGMDMEIGWAPVLIQQARNTKVLPGGPGYIDASTVITPLQVPTGSVDRSMGDIHVFGNPHYLLDPIRGLEVARLLRDRFIAIRPEHEAYFQTRYTDFGQRLATALVGAPLAQKYDVEKLALLYEHDRLRDFLQSQGEAHLLGGWFGRMVSVRGTKVVGDHNQWLYFTTRFRMNIVGYLEPKPGIPPTTQHIRNLVKIMRAEEVRLILSSAYFDPRYARFLAKETGAKIVDMANEVEARPGADTYLAMCDYNVRRFVTALGGA